MKPCPVRRATPADLPFVLLSWMDSFRTSHAAGLIPMAMYHETYKQALDIILARSGVEVWVAYDPRESEPGFDLFGWICMERGATEPMRAWDFKLRRHTEVMQPVRMLVHYVYVKEAFRLRGIARALFDAVGADPMKAFVYTFKTATLSRRLEDGRPTLLERLKHARWNPLIARNPKTEATTPEETPA